MVDRINLGAIQQQGRVPSQPPKTKTYGGKSFEDILSDKSRGSSLKFSKHAEARLRTRKVEFTDKELSDIEEALDRAEKKGVREALILTDKTALIASAKNKTVITTVPRDELRQNVFTNIDGAVII